MNDQELDKLIMATLEREQTLESLNQTIVKDVRRRARRAWLHKWGRIVVFSFGLPLLLLAFALGIYVAGTLSGLAHLRFVLLIPLAAVLYLARREMKDFSIAPV